MVDRFHYRMQGWYLCLSLPIIDSSLGNVPIRFRGFCHKTAICPRPVVKYPIVGRGIGVDHSFGNRLPNQPIASAQVRIVIRDLSRSGIGQSSGR